jgi:hypothetical protein
MKNLIHKINRNRGKIYLILADYIIPVPLTIIMFFLWKDKSGSSLYASYIIILGLVYGYILPPLASRIFKLWEFTWSFSTKNLFYHHGFIYTCYFTLFHYLSFPEGIELSIMNCIRIVICNFLLFGVIVSHHEIMAIRQGMIISRNSIASKGGSPVECVCDFSFFCFALLGGAFGFVALLAYRIIVIENQTAISALIFNFVFHLFVLTIASTPYFIKEWKQVAINRKRKD